MTEERIHPLDPESLELFARKGKEGGPGIAQGGFLNGLKVRRIIQLTKDLTGLPFSGLRILDLGCGEGVYAIEAGLRGAEVLALDARTQRLAEGRSCAARTGLTNVTFVQEDVRRVSVRTHGSFPVVYFLGLLYHLDAPDVFDVVRNVYELCGRLLLVDTLISLTAEDECDWEGRVYQGRKVREHEDGDSDEVRRAKVLKSIDNTFSFRFTRDSLLRLLHDAGFSSVLEGRVPFEPGKADDRITLAALKGDAVKISTYPWVNDKSEAEIERTVQAPPREAGR